MARTFSVKVETRRSNIGAMLDPGRAVVIHADPVNTRDALGHGRTSVGFPVLIVTGWVKDPERIAAFVAKALESFDDA